MINMQKIPTIFLGFLTIFSVLLTGFIPIYIIHWLTEIPFLLVLLCGVIGACILFVFWAVGDNMKSNLKEWF